MGIMGLIIKIMIILTVLFVIFYFVVPYVSGMIPFVKEAVAEEAAKSPPLEEGITGLAVYVRDLI